MIYKTAITGPAPRRRRRPRAERSADVLDALRTDEAAARQLADDLAALVDAGLIAPIHQAGELRFAVCEPENGATA